MTDTSPHCIKRIPRIPEQPLAFIAYVLRHCSRRIKIYTGISYTLESIATVSDIMLSWSLGRIVAVILASGSGSMLWQPLSYELFILAGLWTLRNVAYRIREYMERLSIPELLNTTRELLFSRLIQQSQSFLNSNFAGVLANHVRRAGDIIGNLLGKMQYNIIPLAVRFITAGILLWQITPFFVLFIAFFVALGVGAAVITAPRWTSLSVRQATASSRLTGYIVDSTTNLALVRQNVGWNEERQNLDSTHREITQTFRDRLAYASCFWGIFDVVMTFFFCGFMALVAYSWQEGHVTAAQLAMTIGIISNLFSAIASTVHLLAAEFDDIGVLKESLHKISTPLSVYDAPAAPELQIEKGMIEFRDVTFSYSERKNLFDRLSFTIPAGQKAGLVGISGAGKTTICQLLLRAYDVTGGGIYIDGQNIAAITQDSLHAAIAVIPQDPVLFHRTLAENIRYGRRTATDAEVSDAARAAAVGEFINALPERYGTLVGERGVKLSGGQRQRVAIARAIIKDSPILVLDEATSALDSETEKSIQLAMENAMRGRTTLVIAHRLSTLSRMDRIIVMEEGRIVEDGSFEELLEKKGTFHRLWNLQAGGFLPDHFT